jgi:murein DD-endopeptidase MepM/ murein hydrolase activator NlpD
LIGKPCDRNAILAIGGGVDKTGLPTLPERAGSQNSRPALGTVHRACLLAATCVAAWATLALPLEPATAAPAGQDTATQPAAAVAPATTAAPAPGPAIQDTQAMLAVARMAGTLQAPLADLVIDQLVRWQHDLRDRLRGLEAALGALADTGLALPDLTVLSIQPVERTESSGFGWRDDPIRHTRSFHAGTDFRSDPGTPVMAAGDGVVRFCGRLGGYGNVIDIDHGGGVVTRYAHLRRILTKKAAAVSAGEVIGQVGSTGRTTGPHLHFEVRIDGAPVSPIEAMAVAQMQREIPIAGRLAALALSPELQANTESEVDPPKQNARSAKRPERSGRAKRAQVLW